MTRNHGSTYEIYCTYCKKYPVAEVVDSAEEPKLVEEEIRSCHCALVCKKIIIKTCLLPWTIYQCKPVSHYKNLLKTCVSPSFFPLAFHNLFCLPSAALN